MAGPDAQTSLPDQDPRAQRPRELAMSAAWHGGLARTVETTDGARINVVFHGHWSHGFGPDFSDAMLDFGSAGLQTGAVEIHTRSSDWSAHGHHRDQRYNTVILHVVSRVDSTETRREDGKIVPTAVLNVPDATLFAIDQRLPDIWGDLGGTVCAGDLAARDPDKIRHAILRLGDIRLNDRVQRYEGDLSHTPASDVLLQALLDAFGYAENRSPMRDLAGMLIRLEIRDRLSAMNPASRFEHALAALLGFSGFLPLAPGDAHVSGVGLDQLSRIEAIWSAMAGTIGEPTLAPTRWTMARTRPANHPVARLVTAATLLANTGADPFAMLLEAIRSGADVPQTLRSMCTRDDLPTIGHGRAIAIAGSVIVPIALAHARHTGDADLEDAASRTWAQLSVSEWSRPAKRALGQAVGAVPLRNLGERGIQGLLHLDRQLCTPRRCYECPIAAEVVRDRSTGR